MGAAGERRRRTGFLPATLSFVAVFAAGATPIPLYNVYGSADGVSDAEFSLVAVLYFVVAVSTLLVLGRLSNHLGRRTVGVAALVVAIIGCAVLTTVDGVVPLLVGRALQGLAAGLASSTLGAYVVDTAPARPRWLPSTITSAGTNVGLAIGAFGSGFLVDFAVAPRALVYLVAIGVLALCAVAILASSESAARTPGARASLRPRIDLPRAARPFLPAAIAIFVSTWAFGGYFQSFGPSVAATELGSSDALVAAAVFSAYLAPSALGGPLVSRLRPATAQRLAAVLVLVAGVGFVGASAAGSAAAFLVAGVVGGLGMGAGMAASIRILLQEATPERRAGVLSFVYAVSYLGAAVPSLIAGQLSRSVSLLGLTIGYAALAAVAAAVVLVAARNPATGSDGRRTDSRSHAPSSTA